MPSPFPGMDPWLEQPGIWHNLHTRLITALADDLSQQLRPRYYVDIDQWGYDGRSQRRYAMPSPFPGMDPWLEQPGIWHNLHTSLLAALRDDLSQQLRPRYYVDIDQWAYLATADPGVERAMRPDASVLERAGGGPAPALALASPTTVTDPLVVEVEILEEEEVQRFLEVRRPTTGQIVTVIELLSPKNKEPGRGRSLYEAKRQAILHSESHFVEIDLLRAGEPLPILWRTPPVHSAYRILVSRADQRPLAELYPFSVRDEVPRFLLPLLPGDEEPVVDLGALLHDVYDRAAYDLVVDYHAPPEPPLPPDDAAWAAERVGAAAR